MVEINNQRKAFLDMLISEGTDNGRQKTRKRRLWRHCRRRAIYRLLRHHRKLVTLNPKTQINRRRTLPASFLLVDAYRKQFGLKDFSPKSQTLWHCSRLRSVALYLWLIVVISVRQSTVAAISGLHCRALVMVSSSIRLTAQPLQNLEEAGGTVREIDVWAESPRLSPLWLSASSSACHGLLIIVITLFTYKAQRDKMPGESVGERGNYWHADASAWCCCARCKIHEGS